MGNICYICVLKLKIMKIVYQKPKEISLRDVLLIKTFLLGGHKIRIEDYTVEVKHYQFLRKYGLL